MATRATFDIAADQIEFKTQTNGDVIIIRNVHLGQEAAGILATLINSGITLEGIIKPKAE